MIRFGIVGAGRIARKFANDIRVVDNATITAVASRSIDRARAFANEFAIAHTFGRYEDMATSDQIDAVYIATPHNFHQDQSILFMRHGKHVLCEKPIAVNAHELDAMIAVATEHKVVLMEAMWTRFLPVFRHLEETLHSGRYGQLQDLRIELGMPLTVNADETGRILNPDLAGGSLLDVGIYPLSVFRFLTKDKIREMNVDASFTDTGVDAHVSIDMILDNAMKTSVRLASAIDRDLWNSLTATFENGSIEVPHFWWGNRLYENDTVTEFPFQAGGFEYEIASFVETIESGHLENQIMSHAESRLVMTLMDEIRDRIGLKYPFE